MPISNGSLEDENCSDITDWTDADTSPAVSSQCTFDSKECFCFDTNASAATDAYCYRYKDIGSVEGLGNRIVISIKLYHDAIGTQGNADDFAFACFRSDWSLAVRFASDGLFIHDNVGYNEVGVNLVQQDTWQKWTFDVDLSGGVANAVCDVYLDNVLKASGVDCNRETVGGDGDCMLIQYGYTTDDRISHVDWLEVGDGFTAKINIGDVFKDVSKIKINIGDTFKDVIEIKQNIGDVWKDVF